MGFSFYSAGLAGTQGHAGARYTALTPPKTFLSLTDFFLNLAGYLFFGTFSFQTGAMAFPNSKQCAAKEQQSLVDIDLLIIQY